MFQGWGGRTGGNGEPIWDHPHSQGERGQSLKASAENDREGMTRFVLPSISPGSRGDQTALADERGREGTHQLVFSGAEAVNAALAAPASLRRKLCLCQAHLQCLRNGHCQQRINPVLLLLPHSPQQRQIQREQLMSSHTPAPHLELAPGTAHTPEGASPQPCVGVLTHPRVKFPALSRQIPHSCLAAGPEVPRKSGKHPPHFPSRK